MVKPGLAYLDIIHRTAPGKRKLPNRRLTNVSGEYRDGEGRRPSAAGSMSEAIVLETLSASSGVGRSHPHVPRL